MRTLYVRAFATTDDQIKDSFSWDTDSITFVIDNSATEIISSQRILFTGPLIPTTVILETAEGLTTTTKLVGSMKLILTNYYNKHHSYIKSFCVFYPNIPVNIVGVPVLGTFFGDNEYATHPIAEDGNTMK